MGSVVRALAVYGFLLALFRITGKRSLAQITTFDAIVLLIMSEAIQQALIDNDQSMVNGLLIVTTLMFAQVVMSMVTARWRGADRVLNDAPLVLVSDGALLEDRMKRVRVTADDVMERAREMHGLQRLDQVQFAVLERNGGISIMPRESASS